MKLHLLHGAAINNSRTKLTSLRGGFDPNNVIVFETGTQISEILGAFLTSSLFPEEKLFILENPPEDFVPTTNYQLQTTLILWFDHEISEKKPVFSWVKKEGEVLYFPEGKEISVFPLLDYLATSDKRVFLEAEKLKTAGFDIHYLITMVFYLLRSLIATPKNAPQFVRDKLERQRKRFDKAMITKLYRDILEIDFKIKSGLLEKEQAEFLLVSKFINLSSYP